MYKTEGWCLGSFVVGTTLESMVLMAAQAGPGVSVLETRGSWVRNEIPAGQAGPGPAAGLCDPRVYTKSPTWFNALLLSSWNFK